MTPKNKKSPLYPLMLLGAAIIWGLAFTAQDMASTLGAFTIGAIRNFIGSVFLLALIPMLDKLTGSDRALINAKRKTGVAAFTKAELIGGMVCGTMLAVASALQQISINAGTEAGKAAFITALYVVIVPIFALALRKKSPINVWISVAIAAVGFYLLCVNSSFTIVFSDLLGLACAAVFALHIISIDKYNPLCNGVRLSCIQFATACLINTVLALIFDSPIYLADIGAAALPLLYLGIGSSGIAYTLQVIGQRGTEPAAASLILSLESAFGVLGGMIFLGERLSAKEYVGCAVVFFAVILSQLDLKAIELKLKK